MRVSERRVVDAIFATATVLVVAAAALAAAQAERATARLESQVLLDQYSQGQYQSVADALRNARDFKDLERLDGDFAGAARKWIDAAGRAERHRRTLTAGAVALELTAALVREVDWHVSGPANGRHASNPEALPAMSRLVFDAGTPDEQLHDWILAELATWEAWNLVARLSDSPITAEPAWAVLAGKPPLRSHASTQSAFGRRGYLGKALERFPREPRLLLALVEAREAIETRCPELFCFDEMTPGVIDALQRRKRDGASGTAASRYVLGYSHELAAPNLAAFDNLAPVAAQFAALATDSPEVKAEANAHIGYLAIRAGRPDAALAPLRQSAESGDPYVAYLGHYFTGRALDALGRRADAIAAYREALITVPGAPSASTLLAADLLQSDDAIDRHAAEDVLRAATGKAPLTSDPWDAYWYGDARLWGTYMARLRLHLRH